MSQDGNPIRQEKIRKRKELLERGIDPYPHKSQFGKRTYIADLIKRFSKENLNGNEKMDTAEKRKKDSGETRTDQSAVEKKIFFIAGRLMRKRPMGKAAFFNIQDESGLFQSYIRRDDFLMEKHLSEKKNNSQLSPWDLWKLCDIGDIVALRGSLFKTKKGELSLRVQALKILCKSLESLPEKYHGLEDKELKYRYRHLDLIMDQKSREVFKVRSKVIQEIRNFMNNKKFMEVETPVLQSLYGGAAAVPFETHFRRLNKKMYLKISPEIYLKKLIVGGFEKVFEIGKNFRNEGIDRTHNPEFTMMEYYEAYTDYEYQMKQFEKLVCHVVKKIKNSLSFEYQGRELNFKSPWNRMTVHTAVKEYVPKNMCSTEGEIHPAIHSAIKKHGRIDEWLKHNSSVQKNLAPQKGHNPDKSISAKQSLDLNGMNAQEWLNYVKFLKTSSDREKKDNDIKNISSEESKNNLIRISFQGLMDKMDLHSWFEYVKFLEPKTSLEKFDSVLNRKEFKESDLEDFKDELIVIAFEETAEKELWQATFITDFPLAVSPLTKKHRKKEKYPRLVERFEPYIAGMEIGNAYTELNDPVEQKRRLESQVRWSGTNKKKDSSLEEDTFHPIDETFIHALEVGMPPTGGVGLGIERLVMILSDQSSIRDSILFPALRDK